MNRLLGQTADLGPVKENRSIPKIATVDEGLNTGHIADLEILYSVYFILVRDFEHILF